MRGQTSYRVIFDDLLALVLPFCLREEPLLESEFRLDVVSNVAHGEIVAVCRISKDFLNDGLDLSDNLRIGGSHVGELEAN